ncbi:hypothetical protein QE152_g13819 [Popillia japonica]|uniref:ANKLE2 third alpha/beta domain-containing protein n=1 Tax=Popillia japonica TaxID=7064 RepID=A0AAW1LBZ7_POPJA
MEGNVIEGNLQKKITEPATTVDFFDKHLYSIPNGEFDTIYYGVHVPSDAQIHEGIQNFVFTDKLEALKLVKKYKKARFKAFCYYHEAVEFAEQGAEFPNNNITVSKNNSCKKVTDQASSTLVEKYQFRGPKSQDLVKLRKGIENGDLKFVDNTVWENPRYLISSGDTPSILQEGFRYNALHVAAKAKNADMCELILNTIANVDFIELLYGDEDHQNAEDRAKILLDLYLNTPDKGLNETPLHFAVKFGAVKAVEVLVSFPQCDRNVRNKYGKLPSQIICDRCDGYSAEKIKTQIAALLEENYYVPVLRSEDNCTPPIIGEPFSPASPPTLNVDPLRSRMEIRAYAGPMDKSGADKFRKLWKTPPRIERRSSSHPNLCNNFHTMATLKLKDHEKGLETVGRELASKYEIGWKEYWPFLGGFIDLGTMEGLQQLENYLESRNNGANYNNSVNSLSYAANSIGSLNEIGDEHSVESPMTELCKAFQSCTINDNGVSKSVIKLKIPHDCFVKEADDKLNPELSPFMCLEKSCQVFAHRIAIDILNIIKTEDTTGDILETQMKFLEQLMLSYLEDGRFSNVNFHSVHSRLADLIYLQLNDNGVDDNCIKLYVEKIHEACNKNFDCFSSDDESGYYRTTMTVKKSTSTNKQLTVKKSTSTNKQLLCVLGSILSLLKESESINRACTTEEDCRSVWTVSEKCTCAWQAKNTRKSGSLKRNSQKLKMSLRNCYDNVSRRLMFGRDELDHGDFKNGQDVQHIGDITSSDDEFYTPPSSPSFLREMSSEDEQFDESRVPDSDVFIEGDQPTKMDYDVYNALKYALKNLNSKDYPNIYKWHHTLV